MNEFAYYEEIITWFPVSKEDPPSNRTIYVYGSSFGRAVVRFNKDWGAYVTRTGNNVLKYNVSHWAEMPNHNGNWPEEIIERWS